MFRSKLIATMIAATALSLVASTALPAEKNGWFDTYYQYRIPISMNVEKAGWNVVPVSQSDITTAINKNEELKFDPLWFAYNQFKVVEVDEGGKVINPNPTAGFYVVPQSEELIKEPLTGKEQTFEITSEAGAYYLVRYKSEGGGESPVSSYDQIHPIGEPRRKNVYMSSYEPPLLPQKLTEHERLLISDGQPLKFLAKGRRITSVKEVSLKKVKIVFLTNVKNSGKKKWMLYYQPMCNLHLIIPKLRRSEMPGNSVKIERIGFAEKYTGNTKYRLGSNEHFKLWFADTTVKLTPKTPLPVKSSEGINITSAKNEAQSFQIIVRPEKSFDFKGIKVTALKSGKNKIPSQNISVYAIDYVPIKKKSYITPTTYLGPIADALVAVAPEKLSPVDGNQPFWITVKTPAGTPAGNYKGTLIIRGKGRSSMKIPMMLVVYDFELPEYSTFQTNMGGQYMVLPAQENGKTILDYHGLKTKKELKKLVRKYYDLMAANKFYPKTVALFSEIGMNWSPPPEGYNVDKPGNYFKLYDWDFTEFNRDLKHYIDELKVNSFCLTHTNPVNSARFKELPEAERDHFDIGYPRSKTMAWQTFRERTLVCWGKRKGEDEEMIEITQDQWDHLVLDYYRTIAKNLEQHGWLDRVHILIDERSDKKRLLHFLRVLKSDPLTARIKIVACMQGLEYFTYKEPGAKEYGFKGLLTYMPELDESYNRWEKYYFTDYDIAPDRSKLWNYAVDTSRIAIDAPGINNRMVALDIFNRGGSGYLIWDTFIWDYREGASNNPWKNPHCRLTNGGLAFFYPPCKDGLSTKPDYTIIPSLRVMTFRESVDDYEYAKILEDLIAAGEKKGVDVSDGKAVLRDIDRFFYNSVHWSQNDAWYLDLRNRMARVIVDLSAGTKNVTE